MARDSRRVETRNRIADNLLLRPVAFVLTGLVVAWLALAVDDLVPGLVPTSLQFGAESARLLYVTLAGALLTVAGLTFWVRSASVTLAASQYSARVVAEYLEDFYQQSMMSIMLGLFAYVVAVYRVLPVGRETAPHFAVLLGIVLAAGSIVVVMGAIRNAVRSMYPGQLARSITDVTLARIRSFAPRLPANGDRPRAIREDELPTHRGLVVPADHSGFVQEVDEDAILAFLPPGSTVVLRVRVGLFVIEGRPLLRVWSTPQVDAASLAATVRIGRSRILALDAEYGLQQLVDIAVGSLANHGDVGSAFEVLQHIQMVLQELARRQLSAPVIVVDGGTRILRERAYSYDDYVKLAFDRLRRAAVGYPSVLAAMMSTAHQLAVDLREDGRSGRAAVLAEQIHLLLATGERSPDMVAGDLQRLRERAGRFLAELSDVDAKGGTGPARVMVESSDDGA